MKPERGMCYEIAGFQIALGEKVIYGWQMIGGTDVDSDGNVIHWDGYEYVPVKEIDFTTTNLIFAGSRIAFKEFFPIKTADPSSLKVIGYDIGYGSNTTIILSPAEKRVYILWGNGAMSEVDIEGFTHLSGVIFRSGTGKLCYLPHGREYLQEVDLPLDGATLRHVAADFYTDKNGLYYLDSYRQNSRQLEKSNGKALQAVLYDRYFIYGGAAYPRSSYSDAKDLRLDAARLSRLGTPYADYLGDGEKLFELPYSTNSGVRDLGTPRNIVQTGTPPEPFDRWRYFDIVVAGGNLKGNTLYYPSKEIYANGGSYYTLVKTPSGFYGITGSSAKLKAVKLDAVMIYNIDTRQYEPIEIDRFRRLTTNFYLYKGRMYYSDSHPFDADLEVDKLQPICLNGKPTEFFTDGRVLLGGCNFSRLKSEEREGYRWYSFAEEPFAGVDWPSLQVVDEKTLIDKNNIYMESGSLLQIIPRKELGLEVNVPKVLK